MTCCNIHIGRVRAPKKLNFTRKCHGEHLCLAGEVVGSTPTRVEKVGSAVKLPRARLAQWQSNGFVNRRLSVQVTCWAPLKFCKQDVIKITCYRGWLSSTLSKLCHER